MLFPDHLMYDEYYSSHVLLDLYNFILFIDHYYRQVTVNCIKISRLMNRWTFLMQKK